MKLKMKVVMKWQKAEMKIRMKKCGMTIVANIHWRTGNVSLGNLSTRVRNRPDGVVVRASASQLVDLGFIP